MDLIWSCKGHETWWSCDHCNNCYVYECGLVMVWVDDPAGSGMPSGGSEGGGGGGVPNPNNPRPPKDDCAMLNVFYRMKPNCSGGGGSDFPGLDDPCEKTQQMLQNLEVSDKIDSLKTQSTLGGEKGFKVKANGITSAMINGGKHDVDFGDKTGYAGGYHNHTPDGIPMLSPPDIEELLGFVRAQGNYGNLSNAFLGMVVKKPCSTCTGDFKTYHYIIRFSGVYSDALTTLSQDEIDKLKDRYQVRYGMYKPSDGNMSFEQIEKFFFKAVTDMGLDGKLILQRVDDSGIINNISKNPDGSVASTPCL